MSEPSAWIIPAISAASSLVGTIVGGLVTFWSSKKSFTLQHDYDQKDQRNTQLRDATVRFIAEITSEPVIQSVLTRISEQWGPVAKEMSAAQTDREFVALARTIDPAVSPDSSRDEALVALIRSTGIFDDDIRRALTMLTELRLIAPRDVADSAQRVLYAVAVRELAVALSPQRQHRAAKSFNNEVNDFFNRVRHHMNVEDIDFRFFNEDVLRRVLET